MYTRYWVKCIITGLMLFLLGTSVSEATIYFSETSESMTCNDALPWYWEDTQGFFKCNSNEIKGSKHMEWLMPSTYPGRKSARVGIDITGTITNKTIYYAAYFKIQRINGVKVHVPVAPNDTSADKFFDYNGTPQLRWVFMIGKMESGCQSSPTPANYYAAFVDNETWHLNLQYECVGQYMNNANGYTGHSPYLISYDAWHSGVLEVKLSSDNTGYMKQYVDGVLIANYQNIKTVGAGAVTFTSMSFNGTIAQPDYNAPTHYRMIDNLIITDTLQDIIDGGYLASPPSAPILNPPQ